VSIILVCENYTSRRPTRFCLLAGDCQLISASCLAFHSDESLTTGQIEMPRRIQLTDNRKKDLRILGLCPSSLYGCYATAGKCFIEKTSGVMNSKTSGVMNSKTSAVMDSKA